MQLASQACKTHAMYLACVACVACVGCVPRGLVRFWPVGRSRGDLSAPVSESARVSCGEARLSGLEPARSSLLHPTLSENGPPIEPRKPYFHEAEAERPRACQVRPPSDSDESLD